MLFRILCITPKTANHQKLLRPRDVLVPLAKVDEVWGGDVAVAYAWVFGAFRRFRDYDGLGGSFGEVGFSALTSDRVNTSVYASVDPGRRPPAWAQTGPRGVPRGPFPPLPSAARQSRTQLHLQFVGSGVQSQHAWKPGTQRIWQVEVLQSVLPPLGHPGGAPAGFAALFLAAPPPQLASTRSIVAAERPAGSTRTSPLRSAIPRPVQRLPTGVAPRNDVAAGESASRPARESPTAGVPSAGTTRMLPSS
jgi:hypothetical protein